MALPIPIHDADLLASLTDLTESERYDLIERILELEQINEPGWEPIGRGGLETNDFSRAALREITNLSRIMWLKNPLIRRAVAVQADYVWALGVTIRAADEADNTVLQEFLDDPLNRVELTTNDAYHAKETALQVEGNLFFVLFTDVMTKRVRVRSVPFDQIDSIICNPEDAKEHWFYKRIWTQVAIDPASGQPKSTKRTAYYPDWRYQPKTMPASIGEHPVVAERIYHVAVGRLQDMRFGVPETYPALDWATAYKKFLEDWATITRAYARFAWRLVVKGGPTGLAAAKQRLGTTVTKDAPVESNPKPLAGSILAASEGNSMEPLKTAGATTKAEDGRRLLLMVAAAMSYPETMFGDVSVGTLATARSMDRPTELKFRKRQALWTDILVDIATYAIKAVRGQAVTPQVQVIFPDILERDILERMRAIVQGATLDGKPTAETMDLITISKMVLATLGVEDVEAVIAQMFPGNKVPAEVQARLDARAMQPTSGSRGDSGAEQGRTSPVD